MKLLDVMSPQLRDIPDAPTKRDEIDKVAREFEGLLVNELFKVMRKTTESSYLSNQMGKNFQSMLDQEYADMSTEGSGFGLSDMLAKQLGNQLFGQETRGEKFLRTEQWAFPVSGEVDITKGQKFGANRGGLRPDECGDGHCGPAALCLCCCFCTSSTLESAPPSSMSCCAPSKPPGKLWISSSPSERSVESGRALVCTSPTRLSVM